MEECMNTLKSLVAEIEQVGNEIGACVEVRDNSRYGWFNISFKTSNTIFGNTFVVLSVNCESLEMTHLIHSDSEKKFNSVEELKEFATVEFEKAKNIKIDESAVMANYD